MTCFDFLLCCASVVAQRYPASNVMTVSDASSGDRIQFLQRPEQSRLKYRVCDSFLGTWRKKMPLFAWFSFSETDKFDQRPSAQRSFM